MSTFAFKCRRWALCAWLGMSAVAAVAQSRGSHLPSFAQERCPEPESLALVLSQDGAVAHSQGLLLYWWSPRMVLSAWHADEVAQEAAALGLVWLPVLAPNVSEAEQAASLARLHAQRPAAARALAASRPLCDEQLLGDAMAMRHFPLAWLWQRNAAGAWQPQGRPIVSAMPRAAWRLALQERQAEVSGDHGP